MKDKMHIFAHPKLKLKTAKMKTTKIFCLLFTCVLFFTNCKKDSPGSQNNDPAAVDANGNIVLNSDADGAFYSVISRYYDDNSGSTYDDVNFAYAWFGKFPTVKDAGTTTVNSFELTNIGGVNYYTYVGFDPLFPVIVLNGRLPAIQLTVLPGSAIQITQHTLPVAHLYSRLK